MRVGTLTVDPVYDGYGNQIARDILRVSGKPDASDSAGTTWTMPGTYS